MLNSCSKDKTVPVEENNTEYSPTPYVSPNPFKNFPDIEEPSYNPSTVEGVYLGRKLYYDNILSMNGLSCSSCHLQTLSFTNPGTSPNEMEILPHINLGWNTSFGWEGGTKALDDVALADLAEGNIFLNANNDSIKERFKNHAEYPDLFYEAFGVDIVEVDIDERKKYISYALAQFMRTMISSNSRFDKYLAGENTLTPLELGGFSIFMQEEKGDCFHCHGDANNPMWRDNLFHNNGLNSTHSGSDMGRYNVTGNPLDIGKFKTPTLRNIELTGPYMHDGRFETLEEVVEFYSTGLQDSPTIDPLMKSVHEGGVMLTPEDKVALVAFLKSLTDIEYINDSSLSAP
jgi:cytochrome c peroxidase